MVAVDVVRVFTDTEGRFGNELGIVAAADVPEAQRQTLAAELGFSETIFVDETQEGRARAQIYTPAVELPFAGHPTVGLAWWLTDQKRPVTALEVPAGEVLVSQEGDITKVRAQAVWAPEFTFHDLASPAQVEALDPGSFADGHHYAWAWTDEAAGAIRSRMFAPLMGIAEDEATGAAAVRLTARLGRDLTITQGRGSQLTTSYADGWVTLGGRTVRDRTFEH
jgi:predicted PhzF superfamily epimerase YddE/YHI9